MIYVEAENQNLHPDVREQLWLRSSGAHQLMKTYEGYMMENGMKGKDYYTMLEDSPNPPNPSVGTIKADQTRINFDLEVTEKSHKVEKYEKNWLTNQMM